MQSSLLDFQEGAILLVDKPLKWTSFDVVNYLRVRISKALKVKKIKVGHAGTLDPLATGLLLICTGKKTKEIEKLQGFDKEYVGTFKIGATTPSYDGETEENQHFEIKNITEETLRQVASELTGAIEQIPPIFSAIKINGKNAYMHARKNHDIELKARRVHIYQFELTEISLPFVSFRVQCSKGTYIRSLAHDFGKKLNNGAYLTALRRTKVGDYSINGALSLEQAERLVASVLSQDNLVNGNISLP
ncbi:MAG: tRNA pseudouridine(55) synthase TruB [Bacteroidales bacterium]|jgi:tRNA pseudouridine55 synthase|nr:tRNA pseudouridine(55) synthase TruB [Bacteroidales bacterium]